MGKSMKLAVLSLFRNRIWALPRYFAQIEALAQKVERLHVVAVENNSTDNTRKTLTRWKYPHLNILGQHTNDPEYGSVVHPERFRILSNAANIGLDFIADWIDTDLVMFMESDIMWTPETVLTLAKNVMSTGGIIAPMVYTQMDRVFYDFWAFRTSENVHFPTFNEVKFRTSKQGLEQVWSAGTCLMFPHKLLLAGARFDPNEAKNGAIVSFCRKAAELEYNTYVNYDLAIYHPQ